MPVTMDIVLLAAGAVLGPVGEIVLGVVCPLVMCVLTGRPNGALLLKHAKMYGRWKKLPPWRGV